MRPEAEEQRLYEHSASEGNTEPHDANLKGASSRTQPGA